MKAKTIVNTAGIITLLGAGIFATLSLGEPLPAGDYVVVRDGAVTEKRINYTPPPDMSGIKHINGVSVLRPYVRVQPSFDTETETLDGPVRVITDTEVTDTWTKRNLTAEEITAKNDFIASNINKATIEALCHLKNEVREKVESLSAWTLAQCVTAFRNLLP